MIAEVCMNAKENQENQYQRLLQVMAILTRSADIS